jgi:hypothetical protein
MRKKMDDDELVRRQKLIDATAVGKRYIGTIVCGKEQRRIRLVFVEQTDIMVVAEASDPDRPDVKRKFGGKIVFNPKPDKDGEAYSIVLGPAGPGGKGDAGSDDWRRFYNSGDGSLKLRLTATGLEGEASITISTIVIVDFTITLVPEKSP